MEDKFVAKIFIPDQPTKETQEQIKSLGIDLFNLLQAFNHIKHELDKEHSSQPHVLGQLIKAFISVLSTQDPNRMHYEIAREILCKKDPELLKYNNIIDAFAREVCNQFSILNASLKWHKEAQEIFDGFQSKTNQLEKENGINRTQPPLLDIAIAPDDWHEFESLFSKDDKYLWDIALSKVIKSQGDYGKKIAQQLLNKTSKIKIDQSKIFWFNITSTNAQFYLSNASLLLAETIFEDKFKKLISWNTKRVVALTHNVQNGVAEILSPYNKVKDREGKQIDLIHQNNVIGSVSIATIDQSIVNTVFSGANKLNSVIGHKLIRHFPQKAFDQMKSGEGDYRIIRYEGGAKEIAKALGLQSNQHITGIKQLIHAMAYIEFSNKSFSGNLIQLNKYKSSTTHRKNEVYEITVGTPLLPHRAAEEKSLLIPLLSDPPLVGSNQYHARLYLMQMEIMAEFSNQSIVLANHGFIKIKSETWKQIAISCDIKEEILKKIIDRWTQDGDDAPKFLDHIEKDFFTLGNEHSKAIEFLKEQGKYRQRRSQEGKNGSKVRKNMENKLVAR